MKAHRRKLPPYRRDAGPFCLGSHSTMQRKADCSVEGRGNINVPHRSGHETFDEKYVVELTPKTTGGGGVDKAHRYTGRSHATDPFRTSALLLIIGQTWDPLLALPRNAHEDDDDEHKTTIDLKQAAGPENRSCDMTAIFLRTSGEERRANQARSKHPPGRATSDKEADDAEAAIDGVAARLWVTEDLEQLGNRNPPAREADTSHRQKREQREHACRRYRRG